MSASRSRMLRPLTALDALVLSAAGLGLVIGWLAALPWFFRQDVLYRDNSAHGTFGFQAGPGHLSVYQSIPHTWWFALIPGLAMLMVALCVGSFVARLSDRQSYAKNLTAGAFTSTLALIACEIAALVVPPFRGEVASIDGTLHIIGIWSVSVDEPAPIAALLASGIAVLVLCGALLAIGQRHSIAGEDGK